MRKSVTGCKAKLHAWCCHWLATSATFTAKVVVFPKCIVCKYEVNGPLTTLQMKYSAGVMKLPLFQRNLNELIEQRYSDFLSTLAASDEVSAKLNELRSDVENLYASMENVVCI